MLPIYATGLILLVSGCSNAPIYPENSYPPDTFQQATIDFSVSPPSNMTVLKLHFDAEADPWMRPRIWLRFNGKQKVSAMFDTGSDRSVFGVTVPGKTVAANSLARRVRFINDEASRKARKIVRVQVGVLDSQPSFDNLSLDVHLLEGFQLEGTALLGAMPLANFTKSVGGVFGYLPGNSGESDARGWLVVGGSDPSYSQFCDPSGLRTQQLPLRISTRFGEHPLDWVVDGSILLGGGSANVKWVIDTGASPNHEIPSDIFISLIDEIERDGKSTVHLDPYTDHIWVSNCEEANERFPELSIRIGTGWNTVSFLMTPTRDKNRGSTNYLGEEVGGRCPLLIFDAGSDELLLSTRFIDSLFTVFNAKDRYMSFCERNEAKISQLVR